jgi:class 3 adenylate cyclase
MNKELDDAAGKTDIRQVQKGDAMRSKMGVLFADIRNFTSMAESMEAQESFSLVNEIFDKLTPVIQQHKGFIDKFIGDCVMALFPDGPLNSLRCAVDMLRKLEAYNRSSKRTTPLVFGIGVHFGDVMLGTVGDVDRLDATAISDTVNTASRLENLTKAFGCQLLVTQETIDAAGLIASSSVEEQPQSPQEGTSLKELLSNGLYLGQFRLKGKRESMKLHALDVPEMAVDQGLRAGLTALHQRKFTEALEQLALSSNPMARYMEQVCAVYGKKANWDGVISVDKDGFLQLESTSFSLSAIKLTQ